VGRRVLGKFPERNNKYIGQFWPFFAALSGFFFLGFAFSFYIHVCKKMKNSVIPSISIRSFAKLCREFNSGSKRVKPLAFFMARRILK
jgi:hypothetical protein